MLSFPQLCDSNSRLLLTAASFGLLELLAFRPRCKLGPSFLAEVHRFASCRNLQPSLHSSQNLPLLFQFYLSSPWSGLRPQLIFNMAPIGSGTVEELQQLVNKLEARVKQLEDNLTHASGGPKPESGVRMILMGPPGAGMQSHSPRPMWL